MNSDDISRRIPNEILRGICEESQDGFSGKIRRKISQRIPLYSLGHNSGVIYGKKSVWKTPEGISGEILLFQIMF